MPLWLKAWMALRAVCEPHPGEEDLAPAHHEGFPGAQPGFEALALLENGELVGMRTIGDVDQASLLRRLPREVSRIGDRATSQETASR
jgi:hypothetical protein